MEAAEWDAFVVPALPFESSDAAAAYLGVAPAERADRDKVKSAFRRMCLRLHPDKNAAHAAKATEAFRAVTAALHTLTTANFDYERWARNFTIPPMQSLEDVLLLALRGADPDEIEAMLRKRGDYRPHREFGINLAIPWSAGGREEPSCELPEQSEFNTTKQLGHAGAGGSTALVHAGEARESMLARLGVRLGVAAGRCRRRRRLRAEVEEDALAPASQEVTDDRGELWLLKRVPNLRVWETEVGHQVAFEPPGPLLHRASVKSETAPYLVVSRPGAHERTGPSISEEGGARRQLPWPSRARATCSSTR